ncbi:MAG: hypothetical protein AVDCRST_MAG48-761 [uncultured Friedmanniella sp.]|uniref:Uncharacterized protein n=1 Tax=uncultured Friedmanniella sp. TaxID=335381 RepID=A0A6J4K2K2_9ACTN|nr:MAG: hypothetical protein AVDCRST_MAG48-761 [uncultured Friedmanniella sp.]
MTLLRTAGALLLAGLAAAACTAGGEPSSAPEPTPSASPVPAPSTSPTPAERPVGTGGAGSDGLTVRYQGPDGSTRTLRVEDFPR